MKLLIITQKIDINDDNLGFFHCWVEEFAKQCESVVVVCLQKGDYDLPGNVKVLSLGKEQEIQNSKFQILNKFKIQNSKFKILIKIKYIYRFYKYIWRERKNYDSVFVHMNPEYVVLGGLFWRLTRKKIGLWYTHKSVDLKLRLAEKLADIIFTASARSFRLPSNKVKIMGHGIDIEKFQIPNSKFQIPKFIIITAGRVAPVKNLHILIEAAGVLKNKNFDFTIKIAGAPTLASGKDYFEKLKNSVKEKGLEDKIIFAGPILYKNIPKFYADGDLFVNLSNTGSIDKAVLEAMASGLLVLTSNEAFRDILPEKYLTEKAPEQIAEKIIALSKSGKDESLRKYVSENHSLENLIGKIVQIYKN